MSIESQAKTFNVDHLMVFDYLNNQLDEDICLQDDYHKLYNQRSIAKSFTSIAVGLALAENRLALSDKLIDILGHKLKTFLSPEYLSGYIQHVTLDHLLNMRLGFEKPGLMFSDREKLNTNGLSWLEYCFQAPIIHEPGSVFLYSNIDYYLAGLMFQEKLGTTLFSYLKPRLFDPLNIDSVLWNSDPDGYTFPPSDLFLTTTDLLKFGHVLAQAGVWNNKALIPSLWLQQCLQANQPRHNKGHQYSYGFWLAPNGCYYAAGTGGQLCFISKNKIIVTNGNTKNIPGLLDWVTNTFVVE